MPKVTFSIEPVVYVHIAGEGEEESLRVREDGGLVARFLQFQMDNQVYPAVRGGWSGAGSYGGFFAPQDASKIETWLLKQGATQEEKGEKS